MGKQTKSNMPLDYKVLHLIMKSFDEELVCVGVSAARSRWISMCGCFLLLGFVLSLRGNEGFMVEAHGLVSHLHYGLEENLEEEEDVGFVVVPLLGRFKNEDGERWHLMLSVSRTWSGFEVRKWIERVAAILVDEGHTSGPAFCHANGRSFRSYEMDEELHNQLDRIVQPDNPRLIESKLDVRELFSIHRSLRRGSTARADELDISETVTNLHNRWRSTEYLKGNRTTGSMRQYYTSLRLTRKVRLKYTCQL